MRVAVRKIEGVEAVHVSLNRGIATIRFKSENRVSVERVRDAIRRNGFTPKGAEVRARARVVEQNGQLAVALPGQDRLYLAVDAAEAAGVTSRMRDQGLGKTVTIEGVIPESPDDDAAAGTITVRRYSLAPEQ